MAPPDKTLMYGQGDGSEQQPGTDQQPGAEVEEPVPVVEEPGKLIAGRFEILRNLAEGGMGSVYVARQVELNRSVALKVIGGGDEDLNERFRREAVALADISHPAVVEVIDFVGPSDATEGRSYLIMGFVPGHNLEDHLQSIPESHMASAELVDLFLPVASAVVELHANGIIHRDLKPGNLVFAARADGHSSIKLVDFGIAKRELEEGLTAAGFVLGTPAYMAPEAMVGGEKTTAGDVYALGATMFELATGEAPSGSGTVAEILKRIMVEEPQLPNHLEGTTFGALLLRMLGRDKEHRPDALQVFRELEKIDHELYRPPSQPILPAVHPPPGVDADAAAMPSESSPEPASDEIPLGESPLVTMEPQDRPEPPDSRAAPKPDSEPEPAKDPEPEMESMPAREDVPAPPPPPRNWAKLFVLVVGPMVLVVLAAAVWLRYDGSRGKGKQSKAPDPQAVTMRPPVEPAAMRPAAMEPAAMEPAAMEPAAMEPAAMEPAAMAPAYTGPGKARLLRRCRKPEGAKKLDKKARRALRKPATYSSAERFLQALLECQGSKRWRRRRAAKRLAELYARLGRCADIKKVWQTHTELIPKAKKKDGPPPAPKCPASNP